MDASCRASGPPGRRAGAPLRLRLLLAGAALLAAACGRAAALLEGELPPAPAECTKHIREAINWGVATAAYQIEGAWNEGGRSPSVWDTFSHVPGNIKNDANGDVACDHYHKYKEDFKLMKQLGIKHYRLSISWSRILPDGGRFSRVNQEGVAFYNSLIEEMLVNGIEPAVTMFHWDLPQVLHDKYCGPLSPEFVEDFVNYADVLFANFGDRVKQWMTFNEPLLTCDAAYGVGSFAPGYKGGANATYTCAHHVLLAHGRVKQLNMQKYSQLKHKIGIALNVEWAEPMTQSAADRTAAQRSVDIQFGLFADPLFLGKYPVYLKRRFGKMVQDFTREEALMVRGSLDFLGINLYTAKFVKANPKNPLGFIVSKWGSNGQLIGAQAQSGWLMVVPDAIYKITQYAHGRYNRPEIRITENGVSVPGEADLPATSAVKDGFRTDYYSNYLGQLCRSRREGARITHYYAWSFMDNFEWRQGYTERFGITHVNFSSPGLERTVKDSGRWMSQHFFKANGGKPAGKQTGKQGGKQGGRA